MLRSVVFAGAMGLSVAFMPTPVPGALAPKASFQPLGLRPGARAGALSGLKMAPVSSNDFKTGLTILMDGNVYKVLEFLHVKPGKGSAFVRTKLRNLTSGGNLEKTFRAGEMVEGAELTKYEMQYNYMDGDDYVFMDMSTFDTMPVPKDVIAEQSIWMTEGVEVTILKFGDKILDVAVPNTMSLEVVDTEPGVKGNTAQGGDKPATLESGAVIRVPLFITTGEKIKVDTVNKKYLSRDNK
eukprot:Tamp_18493.p1 GENE.Tamp_18493~~Tamp_18493.p1  ORF type:complete len:240 (-),score=68.93 Tamp_18493:245-964(-)